jgi:hypothetical protein
MRRASLLLALPGLAALLAAIAAWWLTFHGHVPRFTEDQYRKIHVGMTRDEVETLLGCPPGDYAQGRDLLPIDIGMYEPVIPSAPYLEWVADTTDEPYADANGPHRQDALGIRVWFDDEGRVIDKYRMGYGYSPSSPLRKALRSLGF